jgi:hypothetical protein
MYDSPRMRMKFPSHLRRVNAGSVDDLGWRAEHRYGHI